MTWIYYALSIVKSALRARVPEDPRTRYVSQIAEWDHQDASRFNLPYIVFRDNFVKLLTVKEYEGCVFLRDGKLYAEAS